MNVSKDKLLWIYRKMIEIRYFEEAAIESWKARLWRGSMHGCIGQEAPAAAMGAALNPTDYFSSSHRGHGHYIAKGLDPNRVMAELFGKSTGYSKGRGGSMHTIDTELRIFGNSLVGSGAHIAAGIGLAIKMKNTHEVVACSFGDGATNTGGWHEGMNFAAAHKLPVVYLCENNGMAVYTPMDETFACKDIAKRAEGYGMPGVTVDGTDAAACYRVIQEAVDRARKGEGPTLIEAKLFRCRGHTVWDPATYRSQEENDKWAAHDAIVRLEESLIAEGNLTAADSDALKEEIRRIMTEAVEFSKAGPEPELTRQEAMKYVYA
jgi:TPP-dependent pyruvate/acetoin dehydrogenase alpha subunit